MNATLGVELPNTNVVNQTTISLGFIDPATEVLKDSITPMSPVAGDGTQIWKITHNGVDTHAIHFHLFDVQLVNRVGWDGAIRLPDPNERGWKDTVLMNPLEDCIVAFRPVAPKVFTNIITNFGWEYVWHCHLLGHEENDMMRPMVLNVNRRLAAAPVLSFTRSGAAVNLTWTDGTPANSPTTPGNSANEVGFNIERATIGSNGKPGLYINIGTALANATSYSDLTAKLVTDYSYRVIAYNAAGNTISAPVKVNISPAAPSNLSATAKFGKNYTDNVTLIWTDNSNNETGFTIQRATNANFTSSVNSSTVGANLITIQQTGLSR